MLNDHLTPLSPSLSLPFIITHLFGWLTFFNNWINVHQSNCTTIVVHIAVTIIQVATIFFGLLVIIVGEQLLYTNTLSQASWVLFMNSQQLPDVYEFIPIIKHRVQCDHFVLFSLSLPLFFTRTHTHTHKWIKSSNHWSIIIINNIITNWAIETSPLLDQKVSTYCSSQWVNLSIALWALIAFHFIYELCYEWASFHFFFCVYAPTICKVTHTNTHAQTQFCVQRIMQ